MVLKMKNFNFWGGSLKNPTFMGRGSRKTNIEGRLPKKGGLGQFADLRGGGGLARKRGWFFFKGGGVDTPMHTMTY